MKITPRREEVNAMIEVMESDEFETMEQHARGILKRAAEVLAMRETYAVTISGERGLPMNIAPYGSLKEAQTAAQRLAGAGDTSVARLHGSGVLQGNLEGASWKGYCQCTHVKEMHKSEGTSRGKCLACDDCDKWSERK